MSTYIEWTEQEAIDAGRRARASGLDRSDCPWRVEKLAIPWLKGYDGVDKPLNKAFPSGGPLIGG